MRIVITTERAPGERRVAMVPDVAARLIGRGASVAIESGAGERAAFTDAAYREKGVEVVADQAALFVGAEVICKVQAPSPEEVASFPEGTACVSFLAPSSRDRHRRGASRPVGDGL